MSRDAHTLHVLRSPLRLALGSGLLAILLVSSANAQVRWRFGGESRFGFDAADAGARLARLVARADATHVLLRFSQPVGAAQRELLRGAGIRLLSSLGDHAYFASIDPLRFNADALTQLDTLGAARAISRDWKLHPMILDGEFPEWATSSSTAQDVRVAVVFVQFHADVSAEQRVRVAAKHGARVRTILRSLPVLVLELPYDAIEALADEDAVQWIEPPLPALAELNDGNRARVGANVVQAPPIDLDGSGVSVLIYDGGQIGSHPDFGERVTIGPSDTSIVSSHATHVAGTVGGDGANRPDQQFRGMAPGVELISYGFEQPGGLQAGFLFSDPGDLEADYGEAINSFGADISNDSIGTNTEPNGFDCAWQGDYGITSALIDAVVRGSLSGGAPFRVIWSAGNERQGSRCDVEGFGDYYSTAPPAGAKNHITVGALNSNDDSVTSFTSWGPTDDGRLKPDLSGPGCQSGGDLGVTSTLPGGSYGVLCGTSMSGPTVTGLGALLIQDFRQQFPGAPDMRNSTLKVLLTHTAADVQNPGPDYQTGYGSVRIEPAVNFLRSGNFLEGEVMQSETRFLSVVSRAGDPELRVTLAWDDVPGTPNVDPALVNDLDLVVTSPSGVRHFPWTLDPLDPSAAATRDRGDHVNNIEQVLVASPEPGAWRVEVLGFDVADGSQSFSIGATPTLINCLSAGLASLDRTSFSCSATARVGVVDCDLNLDNNAVESVAVLVRSDSEPAGEMLTLTESAPESSTFFAEVPISTIDAPGVLLVAENDTVTVEYLDADDGAGHQNVLVTAAASIDCTPPVISNVVISDVTPSKATIAFNTNEPGVATVRYGLACAALDKQARSGFGTDHSVRLTNLLDQTQHFVAVEVEDAAGNTAIDDNSGACYSFETLPRPELFTDVSGNSGRLESRSVLFTPNGSPDFYEACGRLFEDALPTPSDDGTRLMLGNDDFARVPLTDGKTVRLYGSEYSSFFVGSNGYITFGAGDTQFQALPANHFALPRISGWFDDLDPSAAGVVSYKQLSDRIAVTWRGVTERFVSNRNTFQIVMFYDGRIQISWRFLDGLNGITGLSEGVGLDDEFLSNNFVQLADCPPAPPQATDVLAATPAGQPVSIQLVASDDGLPDPPAALEFAILDLPGAGELRDAGGALIESVPFSLGQSNAVEYTPRGQFQGLDSFHFLANDGGAPPEGGDSSPALVRVTVGDREDVHAFLVDDSDPGWSTQGRWRFGQPTGAGSSQGDPTSGFTGANVYGFALDGDYRDNMRVRYLTTGPIDISQLLNAELRFQRWLGVESNGFDHATLEASSDGGNWVLIWENGSANISDAAWTPQTFDLSELVDRRSSLQLRWGMGPTDGSVTFPGWNLDDIVISGIVAHGVCAEDVNADGNVDIADLAILLANFGTPAGALPSGGDIDGNGSVDLQDLGLLLALFGGACP